MKRKYGGSAIVQNILRCISKEFYTLLLKTDIFIKVNNIPRQCKHSITRGEMSFFSRRKGKATFSEVSRFMTWRRILSSN